MLSKFIPEHFIENYSEISKHNYIKTQGFVIYATLSGFTAMSEKLSLKSKEGSEDIFKILNTVFEDIIGIIHARGGSVYKLSGDSLTIFFPKNIPARSVNNCGIELIEIMKKYEAVQTLSGRFKVEIKTGIAFGNIIIGQTGREEKNYFIAGQALDKASVCEHAAETGECIVECSFRFKLGMCRFKNKSECLFIASHLEELFDAKISAKIKSKQYNTEMFTRKILMDKGKEGDFRNCTLLFMSFSGIEYNDKFNYEKLNDLITTVSKTTSKYGGFVNNADMANKISKISIIFGAPVETEKNEEFAARCALEIIESLKPGIKVKIGIHSGNIYFGTIGAKTRKEFTVIGSAVNLSKALMASCKDNEILISKTSFSKIQDAKGKNERSLILKGIKEKLLVSTLKGFNEKKFSERIKPVCRDSEINEYKKIIQNGKIKQIVITAETGSGKSVLAVEFEQIAGSKGKVFYAECLRNACDTPYYVIKELINKFLDSISTNRLYGLTQILTDIKEDSNLDVYADFMGLSNTKVRTDESMKNIIEDLTVSIFQNFLGRIKTYIFIEDLHWIDAQSLKILKKLLELTEEMNCVFHMIYRPDEKLTGLSSGKNLYTYEISNLTKDECKLYINQKFNIKKIPENIFDMIYLKSKGNPLFVDEIVLLIKAEKGIKTDRSGNLSFLKKASTIEIPKNIGDIILSRLDHIDINSRKVLEAASVIGRVFPINILNQLKEIPLGNEELNLKTILSDLTEMNFTLFEINKEDEYLFRHSKIKDAIYEALPLTDRKKYHEQIAMIYEDDSRDGIENIYELLAYHYNLSGNKLKAKQYLLLSARKSFDYFSYDLSLKFLDQYQKIRLSKEEKARSYFLQAEILKVFGRTDEGIILCEKVKKMFKKGQEFYDKAIDQSIVLLFESRKFDKVLRETELFSEESDIDLLVKANTYKGFVQLLSGQPEDSEHTAGMVYSLRNKVSDPGIKALVLNLSGKINLHKKNITLAKAYFEDMLRTAIENDLTEDKLKALQNLSVCYETKEEYKKAKEFIAKIFEESLRIHNWYSMLYCVIHIKKISDSTGDYRKAAEMLDKALKIFVKYGYDYGVKISKELILEIKKK